MIPTTLPTKPATTTPKIIQKLKYPVLKSDGLDVQPVNNNIVITNLSPGYKTILVNSSITEYKVKFDYIGVFLYIGWASENSKMVEKIGYEWNSVKINKIGNERGSIGYSLSGIAEYRNFNNNYHYGH